jgi:hypothetical protein
MTSFHSSSHLFIAIFSLLLVFHHGFFLFSSPFTVKKSTTISRYSYSIRDNEANNYPFAFEMIQSLNNRDETPTFSQSIVADEEEEGEETEDEDDDEEPEEGNSPQTTDAPSEGDGSISLLKQGINFPTTLNGSDVRVGIIMARWNNDIIEGLYQVTSLQLHQIFSSW